jgi:CD63 antigen
VLNDVSDYGHFLEGRITAPPIMLIIAGLLIFLIAFFGNFGQSFFHQPFLKL